MADQVDSMSDAELRTKLAEHGFPVMPITASTRKVLVKKLKLVLDNKIKPRNSTDSKTESRQSLAKFSSGEESDIDTSKPSQTKKSTRTSAASKRSSMLPPASSRVRRPTPKKESPVKRDLHNRTPSEDEEHGRDDYETGSDSDVDAEKKSGSSPLRNSSRLSDYISSTIPTNDAATSPVRPSIFSRPSLSTGAGYTSASTGYTPTYSSSDHLNSIRSRLGLTSSYDRPSIGTYSVPSYSGTSQQPTSNTDEFDYPSLNSFTKRLGSLKSEVPRTTSYLDRDGNNGSTILPRRSYITGVSRSDAGDYRSNNGTDRKFLKNNLVSLAIVGVVALFFFCLVFMYIIKRNDITSIVDDQNSIIPVCQLNIPGNRPGINCVPKDQVSFAKDLLKVIHPEITTRAASFKCGKPGVMPYLTDREVLDIAMAKTEALDSTQCRTDLHNLQVLIVNNPRWGLSIVQLKSLYSKEADFSALTSAEEVARQRSKGTVAIAVTDPSTPLTCLAVNTLYSAGSTIVLLSLVSILCIGLQRLYKYYLSYRKRKSDEVYSMVCQVIDIISQESEDSGEPYVSVDHVRDTLISPQNREKMSSVWDAAIKFIQKNESRVRMEVQSVNGEDCRVWRWISGHNSPRRSGGSGGAAWQGQAFETEEGSVNNLAVSPTPCLKIRYMFEKNETNPNLRTVIQDAILEKCGERCNILHIDIERTSCCVYVKCASTKDAGVVYRSLHGWWYEGRLITVKYLRLERYMQRFPNSPSTGPYLTSSRQKHFWDE